MRWYKLRRLYRTELTVILKLWSYNQRWATNRHKRIIWNRVNKTKEKIMMIAFMKRFGMDKLASDRKDRDIATADRYLRIKTGNTARRNSIGSCVCVLCGNSYKIAYWCRINESKTLRKLHQKFEWQDRGRKNLDNITCRDIGKNIKKIMFAFRFSRSETNVGLLEESRKPTPWWFSIFKNRCGSNPQYVPLHVPPNKWKQQDTLLSSPSNH